jgi:hypothetical protein
VFEFSKDVTKRYDALRFPGWKGMGSYRGFTQKVRNPGLPGFSSSFKSVNVLRVRGLTEAVDRRVDVGLLGSLKPSSKQGQMSEIEIQNRARR